MTNHRWGTSDRWGFLPRGRRTLARCASARSTVARGTPASALVNGSLRLGSLQLGTLPCGSLLVGSLLVGSLLLGGGLTGCSDDDSGIADECTGGEIRCGDVCVDPSSDPRHCGGCDHACAAGEVCSGGSCETDCASGLTPCGQACVDTDTDERHCGGCDAPCDPNETCEAGRCEPTEPVDPPTSACTPPIALEDTSSPDQVVGDGSAASCDHAALEAAVAQGGIIAFDCGPVPVTIAVTAALTLRTDVDTVVDGGGLVTLDGGRNEGRANRIFEYHSPNYRATSTRVVLQRLTLQNAEAPAADFTPQDPAQPECAWGYKDGEGGAIRMRDGILHVIDCVFRNNHAATPGPDTGGGAIFALGALEVVVVGSTFVGNEGSNGGAIGLLQSDGHFFNSVFEDNHATGEGQNFGGATGCPEFNHAEQGGAGGNGGAIGIDGGDVEDVELCGVILRDNTANELAIVGRTPNSQRGRSTFDRCLFEGNHAGAGGGALWMQDMELVMRNCTIAGNSSDGLGAGVRVSQGPHGSTVLIENTTFWGNVAYDSLGGGLVFAGPGVVRNCTFAENEAAGGEGFFGAAIVAHGPGYAELEVHNTIFWNNLDDHEWTPMTCSIDSPGDPGVLPGAGNIQWPELRNGPHDQPDNPCTPSILWADADLGALGDHGGFTPTLVPNPGSPALGIGDDCPAYDQRGEPRPATGCAAGAVEP